MKVIGLTGGIGVGKTTVAELFEGHGAVVVDCDALGREVIAPGGLAVDAVVERFGDVVRADDGSIDRAALAPIVFGDPDALADLNAISHPAINTLLDERLEAIKDRDANAVVILDMAVLTESDLGQGITNAYETVVVVEAPVDVRLERLIARGHTEEDARGRMASQATDDERRAIADVIIVNDGELDHLAEEVADAWRQLTATTALGSPDASSEQ